MCHIQSIHAEPAQPFWVKLNRLFGSFGFGGGLRSLNDSCRPQTGHSLVQEKYQWFLGGIF